GGVEEVVRRGDVVGLIGAMGHGGDLAGTVLDSDYRGEHPLALAQHFHYPHTDDLLPRYRQNLGAAVVGRRKLIVRREGLEHYDLQADPDEATPLGGTLGDFEAACRRDGAPAAAIAAALAHLRRPPAPTPAPPARAARRPRAEVLTSSDAPLAGAWLARGSG